MLAWKPVSRAEVGIETGFHAGISQNADGKKLLKAASIDENLMPALFYKIRHFALARIWTRGWILKIIPVGIPTNANMKTGF